MSMEKDPLSCLGVGELIDMKWKVGVAMSSDASRNLNSPYVCMSLTIADPAGKKTVNTFEMTLQQFQDFSKQMRDMAAMLATV